MKIFIRIYYKYIRMSYLDLLPNDLKSELLLYMSARALLEFSKVWSRIRTLSNDFWIKKLFDDFGVDFSHYEYDGFSPHELYHIYTVINEITPEFYDDIDLRDFIDGLTWKKTPYKGNLELLMIFYNNPTFSVETTKNIVRESDILDKFYEFLLSQADRNIENFLYKIMILGSSKQVQPFVEKYNIDYKISMSEVNKLINMARKYIHE